MTPAAQQRIRDAAARFADELIAALVDELAEASSSGAAPVELLSIEEASDRTGVARSTFYQQAIATGRIATVRVGRRRLVPSSALAEFIASAGDRA